MSGCVGHCDGLSGQESESPPSYRVVRAGTGWPGGSLYPSEFTSDAGRSADCDCTPRGAGRGRPVPPGNLELRQRQRFPTPHGTRLESRPAF
jgi:hypothetical protein